MFRIHMLPAFHGDCLWIEYGSEDKSKFILIDGGTTSTWPDLKAKLLEVKQRLGGKLHIELFVITHVDSDHIGGALKLLEQRGPLGITFGEVWFNGFRHLDNEQMPLPTDVLGGKQGEQLSALIDDARLTWNQAFGRRAVMVPDVGPLPIFDFGGMKLTLLSPTFEKLQKLKPVWEAEVRRAGLVPGEAYEVVDGRTDGDILGDETVEQLAGVPFKSDTSQANGSSIAFLAEYERKTVFFGADAHAGVVYDSLKRGPLHDRDVLEVAAFKVSHHGSKGNTSEALVKALPARHYLISTNGDQFEHPDPEAVARIAAHGPNGKRLHFNYKSPFNKEWSSASRRNDWHYSTEYGADGKGLQLDL